MGNREQKSGRRRSYLGRMARSGIWSLAWARGCTEVLNQSCGAAAVGATAAAAELRARSLALKAACLDPETGAPIYSHAPGSPELLAVGKAARELAAADPGNIQDPAESLAFWINVYNSLTIHALAVHQVRETVWEVPGFFDRVAYRIAGLRFALNDVEHGILRANRPELLSRRPRFPPDDPRFRFAVPSRARDPRVHFALNCGSRSCPPIGQYEGTLLDAQLDAAARSFLLAETEVNGYTVTTSSLLNWYGADFGELVSFLAGYLPEVAALPARRVRLRFRAYDWSVG